MDEFHWTEVDGVTTIWAEVSGPLRAQLLFRAGYGDETLITHGQTHLIEHLAFSGLNNAGQTHGGFVNAVFTGFSTVGSDQEVSGFLHHICGALTSLPADRLESEKQILRAEEAARSSNVHDYLFRWRYGAKGYGLCNMPQYGLRKVTIEQLQNYSTQKFTRQNAVLWLSDPPPADLRLYLPEGVKCPIPRLEPILPAFPCWFVDDTSGGIAVGSTVPRSFAGPILCEIITHRLYKRLRTTHALSYNPMVNYFPLDADTAHVTVYADSPKDHREKLAKEFGELIAGLGEIEPSEVENARQSLLKKMSGSLAPSPDDRRLAMLSAAAWAYLFGNKFETIEDLEAGYASVAASDVSRIGFDLQKTALFALPGEAKLQACFGEKAPFAVASAVKGRKIPHADAPINRERLVLSPEGVSHIWPDGSHLTVRYAELAAAYYFEDGCVCLISEDLCHVAVEPLLWRGGKDISREIREQVPEQMLFAEGSRTPDAIPRPRTTAWQRIRAFISLNRRWSILIFYIILFIICYLALMYRK